MIRMEKQLSKPNTNTCPFCIESVTGLLAEEYRQAFDISSRIVYEDSDFLVLPSISPLAIGHVMIVPKQHVTSLVQMEKSTFDNLSALKSRIVHTMEDSSSNVLWWEHGIALGASGGCGVSHAHIHFLPLPMNILHGAITTISEKIGDSISIKFSE